MYWNEIKKISLMCGFSIAIISLVFNLFNGIELLSATMTAIEVFIIASMILFFSLRSIGKILTNFLIEQQKLAEELKEQQAQEKKAQKGKA